MSNTPVVVAPVVVEPTVVATAPVATKAPKKPSLPAKYSKFLSFAFWFASRLEPDARDAFYQQFKLFSSLEEQTEFFQTYLDEASASNKIMRKTIANHNKPVKTRATKASRKPSKPVAAETDDLIATLIADANGEPLAAPVEKPKKNKKSDNNSDKPKKNKKSDNNSDKPKKTKKTKASEPLDETVVEPVVETVVEPVVETVVEPVVEPVVETVVEPVVEPVTKPLAKKTTKPKAEKVEKPKTEKVEKPKAEKAEKPKKVKKDKTEPVTEPVTKPVTEPVTEPVAEDDDSIQTRIITMKDGVQFLIDSDNNLYDMNSHEVVGTYNPDTESAIIN